MATLKLVLSCELEGVALPGTPFVRRLEVDEAQPFVVEQASGAGFVAVPGDLLATIQALLLQTDQPLTLRVDGQSDAGIVVNAGGLVLLFDVTIDAGAGAPNAKTENTSGATAELRGAAVGT